eukprot:gene7358-24009_t
MTPFLLAAFIGLVSGRHTGAYPPDNSDSVDFICAYREYAYEFGLRLRPDLQKNILFDALMLGVTCNKTEPSSMPTIATTTTPTPPSAKAAVAATHGSTLYVAPTGSDSNKGTQTSQLKSLTAAVAASRSLVAPKAILMEAGTYYEGKTVELTAADSDLAIAAVTGAEDSVWITGAAPLPASLQWEKYKSSSGCNIWKTQLPTGMSADQLRVDGNRSPRARPVGWVPSAQKWLPANPPPTDLVLVNVTNDMIAERGSSTFTDYLGGIGGPCSHFTPPFSYWCSLAPSGGGGFQYYLPSGMTWSPGTFPDGVDFSNTSKAEQQRAVFQVWRRSHWANWMFEVDEIDQSTSTITFGKGGFQGSRGGDGSDWYLENMLDLLDAPNEHYYDPDTGTLYYQPNSTDAPPSSTLELAAPALTTILQVNATQSKPLLGLTLQGIGFRDAFKIGAIHSYGNVMAYVGDYGAKWSPTGNVASDSNTMHDNVVIFQPDDTHKRPSQYHDCEAWNARNNSLYGEFGVTIMCANYTKYNLSEWQALDPATHDVGSTYHAGIPSGAAIVAMARTVIDV